MKLKHIYLLINMSTLIICVVYNTPQFITYQFRSIKKFFKTSFRYVICDNSPSIVMSDQIKNECQKLDIGYHRVPNCSSSDASEGCAKSCQYSIQHLGINHPGLVLLIDCDMFFIEYFDIELHMKDCDLSGIYQMKEHIRYFTNQFLIFNMNTLKDKASIDLSCGIIDNVRVDVGGYLYHYMMNHPEIRINYIVDYICTNAYNEKFIRGKIRDKAILSYFLEELHISGPYPELYLNQCLLHYRSGTNWNKFSNEIVSKRNINLFKLLDQR